MPTPSKLRFPFKLISLYHIMSLIYFYLLLLFLLFCLHICALIVLVVVVFHDLYILLYREGLKLFLHPQVLDGFLLVLTADGTILYVSDNVLQYLGYNQVRTNTFTLPTTLTTSSHAIRH